MMLRARHSVLLSAALTILSPAALAAQERPSTPDPQGEVIACAGESDSATRLACYDRTVATLMVAVREGTVAPEERAEAERSRRNPALAGPDGEELDELETTVASVGTTLDGKLILRLENGAVWRQTDNRDLARPARPGMSVKIRKAAFGSFLVNVDNQTAIRVSREN